MGLFFQFFSQFLFPNWFVYSYVVLLNVLHTQITNRKAMLEKKKKKNFRIKPDTRGKRNLLPNF